MSERDYIDATNVAKARIALAVARDILPMSQQDEEDLAALIGALRRIESRLEVRLLKEST